jgi:hypothetical protein
VALLIWWGDVLSASEQRNCLFHFFTTKSYSFSLQCYLRTDVPLASQPLSYGKSIRHCKTARWGIFSGGSCYEKRWFIGIQFTVTGNISYKKFWEELIAYIPWYDTGHIKNEASKNSSIVVCVSTEQLPSNDWGIFTEPLGSNDKGGIHRHTHTQTATWSHKPTPFFQNKESRLKSIPFWDIITVAARQKANWVHTHTGHLSDYPPIKG